MMLPLLFFSLLLALPQGESSTNELPEWTNAPAEANLFVVKTERLTNHARAQTGLLLAVKAAVAEWAKKNVGAGCLPAIESMKLEDFQQFIHENQYYIHEESRSLLGTETDIFYWGYARVRIDQKFFDRFGQELRDVRLKKKLSGTLLGALFLLGTLGIVWNWLYMRHKSRGLYIKRIRWITGALAVLLLLVCYLVFRAAY